AGAAIERPGATTKQAGAATERLAATKKRPGGRPANAPSGLNSVRSRRALDREDRRAEEEGLNEGGSTSWNPRRSSRCALIAVRPSLSIAQPGPSAPVASPATTPPAGWSPGAAL